MNEERDKLKIMVSSTVYGIEELLDRIYTLLSSFGYEVWMSHKGTVPVFSNQTAFENCLQAVKNCDLFLGIITPNYGSGQNPKDSSSLSITHQEILKAIELNKPRWLLAHENVVFARSLLNNLGYKGKTGRAELKLKKNQILTDLRIIDLYEDATIDHESPETVPLDERKGNGYKSIIPTMMAQYSLAPSSFAIRKLRNSSRKTLSTGNRFRKMEVLHDSGTNKELAFSWRKPTY